MLKSESMFTRITSPHCSEVILWNAPSRVIDRLLELADRPVRVAVVGAGPAGFYAAEALLKSDEPRADQQWRGVRQSVVHLAHEEGARQGSRRVGGGSWRKLPRAE